MSRRRKPNTLPIAVAVEALAWRARILLEFLEGADVTAQTSISAVKLQRALEDYEASRATFNRPVDLLVGQMEMQP